VHAAGGTIVMQVMNGGRVSHPDINGADRIVAPSAIAIDGEVHVPGGKKPFPVPHALTREELATVRDEFVAASARAVRAGLDGVELHLANGYLLHQFLSPSSNVRTDEYGGSSENRVRFPLEVIRAVADEIGAGRVAIRISPEHNIQGVLETDRDDVRATYGALVDALAPLSLAYLSVLHADPTGELVQELRARFGGGFMVNSGFGRTTERAEALALIEGAHADVVAVGRALIANPDLVERWRDGQPENPIDAQTFYSGGARGYTDYPRLRA
jgi:N-ethylmaleimide reductase